jgi:8-oxo-dGTP diphosphatase
MESKYHENTRFLPFTLTYLFCDGKLLVLQKPPGSRMNAGKLIPPGGKIEPGESVLESATREFHEETGAMLLEPFLWGTFSWVDNEDKSGIMYIAKAFGYSGEILSDTPEGAPVWINEESIDYGTMPLHQRYILPNVMNHSNRNLYCAHAIYDNGKIVSYIDSNHYFQDVQVGRAVNQRSQ